MKKDCNSGLCNRNTCMECPVKHLSLLEGLSSDELILLNESRGNRLFKAGEFIYKAGEISKGLLALHHGKVKITKSGLFEHKAIIGLKKPGDFLGLRALVLEKEHSTSATALEDCSICIIDRNHFLKVIKGNIELTLRVMRLLALESQRADERMLILTQKHLRGRLADALLLLHHRYGTLPQSNILNIELKRADLAALANMTAANAIRVLSHFSKEKIIKTNKRQIEITDMEGLKKISQLG